MKKKMIMLVLLVALPFQTCLCNDSSNGDSLERQLIEKERLEEEALLKEATDTSLEELERLARLEREAVAEREHQQQRQREHEEAMARLKQQQEEAIRRAEEQEQEMPRTLTAQPEQPAEDKEKLSAKIPLEPVRATEKTTLNSMPPGIKKFTSKNTRINRVVTINQLALTDDDKQELEDVTCGPRIIFIADAINSIVKDGRKITPESIHAELSPSDYQSEVHACLMQESKFSSIDFGPFMEKNGIKIPNLFLLGFYENQVTPLAKSLEGRDFQELPHVPHMLKALRAPLMYNTLTDPIHIICSDDTGNWFLFSIIPYKGQPQVWYIDPKNVNFIEYKPAHPFLTYIVEHLMPTRAQYSHVHGSSQTR